MGFFDSWDSASVISRRSSHHGGHTSSKRKHRSTSRSKSRPHLHRSHHSTGSGIGSVFGVGGDSHYHKNNSSRGSFFGLGGNPSRGSLFGSGRSSSYYKRSPRPNFVQRTLKQLKRLLRDLVYYAKRHPLKVFALVVMPLVTGGALTALLARFGIRLPPALERMLGIATKAASADGLGLVGEAVRMASDLGGGGGTARVERGRDGDYHWERRSTYSGDAGWGADRDRGWGDSFSGFAKSFW